jgi:hypothetical protein
MEEIPLMVGTTSIEASCSLPPAVFPSRLLWHMPTSPDPLLLENTTNIHVNRTVTSLEGNMEMYSERATATTQGISMLKGSSGPITIQLVSKSASEGQLGEQNITTSAWIIKFTTLLYNGLNGIIYFKIQRSFSF